MGLAAGSRQDCIRACRLRRTRFRRAVLHCVSSVTDSPVAPLHRLDRFPTSAAKLQCHAETGEAAADFGYRGTTGKTDRRHGFLRQLEEGKREREDLRFTRRWSHARIPANTIPEVVIH